MVLSPLLAKPSDYLMDEGANDNGLPESSVTSIAQTPDGDLWIGNGDTVIFSRCLHAILVKCWNKV